MTEPRRIPSTVGGLVYLLVVGFTTVGLGIVAFGPWRRGIGLIGVVFLLGALLRLSLPENDAGMLRVRRRLFDVLLMAVLGVALLVLARIIPDQPPL